VAATLMEGRPLAERIRANVAAEVEELGEVGLATVQVGEDEASTIYLRLKHTAAAEVEIGSVDHKLPHTMSEDEVLATTRSTGSSCSCRCPTTSTRRA
jgi:methylenetetrahydrofolate dehydrogenase (NADP+)/methenyltetrahydrofolate cyclohydrolase